MDAHKQREQHIKANVIQHLVSTGRLSTGDTVINEFTLDFHARRADLVITDRERLFGVEIKSSGDTLNRLDAQIGTYLEYFDKAIIVSASNHIPKVLDMVPENVEVWENTDSGIKIRQKGKIIPVINRSKLIHLMTVRELINLANQLGISPKKKNRALVADALQFAPVSKIKSAVCSAINNRYKASCFSFWQQVGNRTISAEDIEYLSPYRIQRALKKSSDKDKYLFFSKLAVARDTADDNFEKMLANGCPNPFGNPPLSIRRLLAA